MIGRDLVVGERSLIHAHTAIETLAPGSAASALSRPTERTLPAPGQSHSTEWLPMRWRLLSNIWYFFGWMVQATESKVKSWPWLLVFGATEIITTPCPVCWGLISGIDLHSHLLSLPLNGSYSLHIEDICPLSECFPVPSLPFSSFLGQLLLENILQTKCPSPLSAVVCIYAEQTRFN